MTATVGRPAQSSPPTFGAADYMNATALLKADDVAARWGVPRSTVYRLVRSGELPVVRLGKHFRFRAESIVAWEAAREGRADA